jgi:hypothetical protein
MKGDKQAKVFKELTYMEMTLNILSNLFAKPDGIEKPVMGWKIKTDPDEPQVIHRFSCIKVAAGATGCNQSKVSAVCKGKRAHTGSDSRRDPKTGKIVSVDTYKFVYEENYEKDLEFLSPDKNKFKPYEQENNTPETDGDI